MCVVVQRCEALYQSTAQIGPSMKGTFKKSAKRKRKDIPLFCQNACIFSVWVFSSLNVLLWLLFLFFEGRWCVKARLCKLDQGWADCISCGCVVQIVRELTAPTTSLFTL